MATQPTTRRRMRPSPARPRAEQPAAPAQEAQKAPKTQSEWALGIALLAFGGLAWLGSAKYTLIGWIVGLNTALAWLGLPLRVPPVAGWFILLAVPLGVVYSRVETRVWRGGRGLMRSPLFWLGWVVIVATDVGSTYLGVRTPPPDAWPITIQIASSGWVAFVVSLSLTFIPEWMLIGAKYFFKR
jgi:hypothetical protein